LDIVVGLVLAFALTLDAEPTPVLCYSHGYSAKVAVIIVIYKFRTMVRLNRVMLCRGTQPGSKIYHVGDGWHYRRNVFKRGTMYLKCVKKRCFGRALCDRWRGFLHTGPHNHNRNRFFPLYLQLRRRILQRCRGLEFVSFRRIVVEESRR